MEETATSHGGVGEGFMVVTSELLSDTESGAGGQKRVQTRMKECEALKWLGEKLSVAQLQGRDCGSVHIRVPGSSWLQVK